MKLSKIINRILTHLWNPIQRKIDRDFEEHPGYSETNEENNVQEIISRIKALEDYDSVMFTYRDQDWVVIKMREYFQYYHTNKGKFNDITAGIFYYPKSIFLPRTKPE